MKRTAMLLAVIMMSIFSYSQIIDIPDVNFKNALLNTKCANINFLSGNYVIPDLNNDGEIQKSEADKVVKLKLNGKNIRKTNGVEQFINLEWLEFTSNQIDSFNIKDNHKINILDIGNNDIKYLNIDNCTKLSKLIITSNPINKDNLKLSNIENLIYLSCSGIAFDSFDLELPNLETLWCNNFKHVDVDKYKNLKELSCTSYKNEELDVRQLKKLTFLDCSLSNISKLNISGLANLEYVRCFNNSIDSLDLSGLIKLDDLRCSNNKIQYLDLKDCVSLEYLSCAVNNLKFLDASNCSNLSTLYCYANNIEYISTKNGKVENNVIIHTIPLKYFCCDENELQFYKDYFQTISSLNPFTLNTYCSFTPGGKFYSILGNNDIDLNNNGCDNNDVILPNLKFNISSMNTTGTLVSNTSGNYFIPVQEGTHIIKPILENPEYFNVSPDSIKVTFPSTSDTITQDFCISPKGILKHVDISIIPLTPPARPGFNASYKVVLTNKGNQVENGTLYFSYDEAKMDFVLTDVSPTSQGDGLLSWDFTDLLPFETRYYNVTINVNSPGETPPVYAGDELLLTCNILDNVFLLKQEVVGSYDPNDKTCLEGKTITPEQVGDYVHYLIRFENTGNYAAENVVVKDVIEESTFDISTLQITDASHESWARINGNIVEFIFENIQLPFDDATNDGYICFKIKTKPTLVLGNELKNEANIYFDYNLPILTNKTNTVVAIPVGTDEAVGESDIEIFPNPVSDMLKFSSDDKILKVEIFDMSGRLAQVSSVVEGEVNVEGLLSGAYLLKVYTQLGVRNSRMVKI